MNLYVEIYGNPSIRLKNLNFTNVAYMIDFASEQVYITQCGEN